MYISQDMKRFLELNSDLIEEDHSALYYVCPSILRRELVSVFKSIDVEFKPSIYYEGDEHMKARYLQMIKLFG